MKALGPCAAAAAWEVVAGAEPLEEADEVGVVPVAEPLEEPDEVGVVVTVVPVPEAVPEADKVTPYKTRKHLSIFTNLTI